MTEIRHIQHGDLVILSTGEEAIAIRILNHDEDSDRYRIEYRENVTGWIGEDKQCAWWYEKNGRFAGQDTRSMRGADIVKVVHNGSIQTENQ